MRRRILRILLQRGERGRLEKEQEQGRRRLDLHKVGWFGVNSLNVILLRATVRRKVGEAKGGAIRARGRIRDGILWGQGKGGIQRLEVLSGGGGGMQPVSPPFLFLPQLQPWPFHPSSP